MSRDTMDYEYARLMEEGYSSTTTTSSVNDDSIDETKSQHQIVAQVEAPATLVDGYIFLATTSNDEMRTFPVRVPPGGVSMGETIRVPIYPLEEKESFGSNDDANSSSGADDSIRGNENQWKAGICSCFARGFCHADAYSAWFCPQLLLGQILVRTNLTPFARPCCVQQKESKCFRWTLRILVMIVVIAALNYRASRTQWRDGISSKALEAFWCQEVLTDFLSLPMYIWALLVLVRLRRKIRERYKIAPARISLCNQCTVSLGNSEDLVCALCCSCCALSQMAHQTADCENGFFESCDCSCDEEEEEPKPTNNDSVPLPCNR